MAYSKNSKIDRNKVIWVERKNGKKLHQLGKQFGITRERVRQIICRHERYVEDSSRKILDFYEFSRCERRLNNNFNLSLFNSRDIKKIAAMDASELLKAKNLGKQTALRLALALQENGYIDNARSWLFFDEWSQEAKEKFVGLLREQEEENRN